MIKLKISSLLILLSVLFYSCEKEYSLEGNTRGGGGVVNGTFAFTGAPGACNNVTISGSYQAGSPISNTSTVTIGVDVTAIGPYSITTNTNNGFSFSGSGTFTTTGVQTVTLAGSGTPLVAGSFDFSPGINGCSFTITVISTISGTSVFTYVGAPGICANTNTAGVYTSGIALNSSNTVTIDVNVTTAGTYSVITPTVNGITFYGTGTFAGTGNQTVSLTGSGTPAAAGNFSFTPSNNGCAFSITVAPPGNTATSYLRCTIGGIARDFSFGGVASIQPDPTTIDFGGAENSTPTSPFFQIGLTKSPMLTIGTYGRFTLTNTSTFCIIQYDDGVSAEPWGVGVAGQTGGFDVVVTTYTANLIEGTFSGTLYDNAGLGTNTKIITAGTFSVPY